MLRFTVRVWQTPRWTATRLTTAAVPALGRRYGRTGQLALSYDMAFVAILLTALLLTRPQPFPRAAACPTTEKRPRADNELLDYAADMTAALAYYNFLDDWQDDHRRASLTQAQKLEPSLPALRERWPRQLQTMARAVGQAERAGKRRQPRFGCAVQRLWRTAGRGVRLPRRASGPGACAAWAMGWGRSST